MNIIRAGQPELDDVSLLFDQYRQFYEQDAAPGDCRSYIKARMDAAESVIFLARSESGEPLGFTQLYNSFCSVEMARLVYLYDLFVVTAARRQGIAKALMNAARDYAKQCGAGRLQLETAISNLAGQSLYESLGWERDMEFLTYHLPIEG